MRKNITPCAYEGCKRHANVLALQSSDMGKTIVSRWICRQCASDWNDGSDWAAPMFIAPGHLVEGDMVDLSNDPHADRAGGNPALEMELQLVADVEVETLECVAVGFEGFDVVGFPTTHLLRVGRLHRWEDAR